MVAKLRVLAAPIDAPPGHIAIKTVLSVGSKGSSAQEHTPAAKIEQPVNVRIPLNGWAQLLSVHTRFTRTPVPCTPVAQTILGLVVQSLP